LKLGKWRFAILAAAAALCACGNPTVSAQTPPVEGKSQQRVPGQYLVTLAAGADARAINDLYGRFGIKSARSIGNDVYLVALNEDPGPEEMEKLRRGNAQIKAVQPNYVYRARGSSTAR
jgi:hypothetical protein